jgi:murein DD-endopeptidase MepM/ murein hydrolase activator NlpD
MQNPIKNFSTKAYPEGDITQYFGENKELYSKAVCFGGDCLQGHNGIDIVAEWGTSIYCVEGGKIVEANNLTTGFGRSVRVVNFETGNEWTYGHLSQIDCVLGKDIKEGDLIGLMGNTGFVVSGATPYWKYNPYAGTHLHLGLRKIEKAGATWNCGYPSGDRSTVLNYTNGFFGGIDPISFFTIDNTSFIFRIDLKIGDRNNDVLELQKKLSILGYFKVEPTGYYGTITAKSVLDFQLKNCQLSWYEKYVLRGSKIGPKTRSALNNL